MVEQTVSKKRVASEIRQFEEGNSAVHSFIDVVRQVSAIPVEKAGNTSLSMHFMSQLVLSNLNKRASRRIPFLIGPPGTGKTYFAEFLAKKVFEHLREAIRSSNTATKEEIEQAVERAVGVGLISENFRETAKESLEKFNSKPIVELLQRASEEYSDEETSKNLSKESVTNFILELSLSDKERLSYLGNPSSAHVVVFPSQETATDFILSEAYVVGGPEIVSRKETSTLLELLAKASEGENIILILDELSETPKRDMDKRPKNLHDFLDAYINNEIYQITTSSLDEKTKGALATLTDKGLAKKISDYIYELEIPHNFYIISTGNERNEHAPVGFTESTWERVLPFSTSYVSPSMASSYIDLKVKDITLALEELKESNVERAWIKRMVEDLSRFADELKSSYSMLYNEFKENREEFKSRMLPSYRTLDGMLRAFLSYSFLSNSLRNQEKQLEEEGVIMEKGEYSIGTSSTGRSTYQESWKNFNLPTNKEFSSFLLALLRTQSYIKVGSYTDVSEVKGSQETEFNLSGKVSNIFSTSLGDSRRDLIYLNIDGNKYYYSYPYMMYVLYCVSSMFAGQKFFLLTGKTQEGKSTMVTNVVFPLASKMLKILGESVPYKDISLFHISNKDELTLVSPRVESEEGEKIKVPLLLKVVEEADKNRNRLHMVLIDEIDSIQFSQHLNHLMTRDTVVVEGKEYYVANLLLFGTSNISTTMLDNFISRSILPMVFLRNIGKSEILGTSIDARSLAAIKDFLASSLGEDNEHTEKIFQKIIEREEDTITQLDFDDIIKAIKANPEIIARLYDKYGPETAVEYLSNKITSSFKSKRNSKSLREGG